MASIMLLTQCKPVCKKRLLHVTSWFSSTWQQSTSILIWLQPHQAQKSSFCRGVEMGSFQMAEPCRWFHILSAAWEMKVDKKTLKWQQQTQEQLFCSICFLDECTIMDIIKQIKLTLLTTCNIRKNSILPHTLPVTRIIFHHQQNRKSVFLQNCCDQHEKTFQY